MKISHKNIDKSKPEIQHLERYIHAPPSVSPHKLDRKKKKNQNDPAPDNFLITKAKPLQHNIAHSSEKQRQKILRGAIDDRYIAENYYKGFADDSILYEKDGTISKMR